jgi:hypothetical protein
MTKRAKGKTPLYVEVPPDVKAAMEKLAEEHNRSVAGEVVTALQRYIRQEKAAAKEEKGGGK